MVNPTPTSQTESFIDSSLLQGLKVKLDKIEKEYGHLPLNKAARALGFDASHYDNLCLAGRSAIHDLKKTCPKTIFQYATINREILNVPTYEFMIVHADQLQSSINWCERYDLDNDWFSGNTMIKTYLTRNGYEGPIVETPQQLYMRIAVQLHAHNGLSRVLSCYEDLAHGYYNPASPTIFNAGKAKPQMSSCFLMTIEDDLKSIIHDGVYTAAMIHKSTGAVGKSISYVRHAEIGREGMSKGLVPLMIVYGDIAHYVDQTGKRSGQETDSCRPHHIDIEGFIDICHPVGDRYSRTYDLNTAVWGSWLFFRRVREDGNWTLFDPSKVTEINHVYGKEFEKRYLEAEGRDLPAKYKKVVKARDLFRQMIQMQRMKGMPYILNGDAANLKSNHRHMGAIETGNLCCEIIEYTDKDNLASCNLSSMVLPAYAKHALKHDGRLLHLRLQEAFDFDLFGIKTMAVVDNLNSMIDHNWYPLDEIVDGKLIPGKIHTTNLRTRPLGIGKIGLAEVKDKLDIMYDGPEMILLNEMIAASLYFNAMARSIQLAIIHGPYPTFKGSPFSEGKLQFDLWAEEFKILGPNKARKEQDDIPLDPSFWGQKAIILYSADGQSIIDTIQPTWIDISRALKTHGAYNSLLTSTQPTASTAHIRRCSENVELPQSNLYSRELISGSYPVLNRNLVADLDAVGAWNRHTFEFLKLHNGSIQGFNEFVVANKDKYSTWNGDSKRLIHLVKKYRTMWEISQKHCFQMAARCARYTDQSISLNFYKRDPTDEDLEAAILYAEMLGLKTLIYYLRQASEAGALIFTVDPSFAENVKLDFVQSMTLTEKKDLIRKLMSSKTTKDEVVDNSKALVDVIDTKVDMVCNPENGVCTSCT